MKGKTILLTAARQGIGRASAVACESAGARVIATDFNSELLSELSEEHPDISTLQLDVCDGQAVVDMAATVGSVDGLFNCVCPGTVDSPSLRGRIASAVDPVQVERDFIAHQPMGRVSSVDDLTPMVTYLPSDASQLVTGQAYSVDGGAGNSTLMKILSGVCARDGGTIHIDGNSVQFDGPRAVQDAGVGIIHQEPSLMNDLTAAQNIFMGREPRRLFGRLDNETAVQ